MTEMLPIADAGLIGFPSWLLLAAFLSPVHVLIAFREGWGIHATAQAILILVALPCLVVWILRKYHSTGQRILNVLCVYAGLMTTTNFLVRLIFDKIEDGDSGPGFMWLGNGNRRPPVGMVQEAAIQCNTSTGKMPVPRFHPQQFALWPTPPATLCRG